MTTPAPAPGPTPYKVSTITACATLCTCIDLDVLFERIPIHDDAMTRDGGGCLFAGRGCAHGVGGVRTRGRRPERRTAAQQQQQQQQQPPRRPPRPPKKPVRFFDHQITLVYVLAPEDGPGSPGSREVHSIKVFHNGNVQMTGVKTLRGGELAVRRLADAVRAIALEHPAVLPMGLWTAPPTAAHFRACLINSDFRAGFPVRRDRLCALLSAPPIAVRCVFETYYPGVKVQFMWNRAQPGGVQDGVCRCCPPCTGRGDGAGPGQCRKVTMSVFQSGCCIVTGAHTYEQLDDAYAFIAGKLVELREQIERPPPPPRVTRAAGE